jgi:hypothetical protein
MYCQRFLDLVAFASLFCMVYLVSRGCHGIHSNKDFAWRDRSFWVRKRVSSILIRVCSLGSEALGQSEPKSMHWIFLKFQI